VCELEHVLPRSVDGMLIRDDFWRSDGKFAGETRAQAFGKISHALEIRHAAPVDPAVELPRMKSLAAVGFQRIFELPELEFRDVQGRSHSKITTGFMVSCACSSNSMSDNSLATVAQALARGAIR